GVEKGGTFILVYDGDVIVADFSLPYRIINNRLSYIPSSIPTADKYSPASDFASLSQPYNVSSWQSAGLASYMWAEVGGTSQTTTQSESSSNK
ncbi:MAG: hypothetical protein JKY54_16625, partial [Flavobacteriales bacterium]|nr:hypothetical protein [Flavobacteriales bacterium]